MILALTRSKGIFDSFAPDPVTRLYYCKESLMCLNNYVLWVKLSVRYLCFFFVSVSLRVFQIMNNDNEPPSLVQFSRNTDEKLTINKCWPNNYYSEIIDHGSVYYIHRSWTLSYILVQTIRILQHNH